MDSRTQQRSGPYEVIHPREERHLVHTWLSPGLNIPQIEVLDDQHKYFG